MLVLPDPPYGLDEPILPFPPTDLAPTNPPAKKLKQQRSAKRKYPTTAMDISELPIFPSSIPAPFAIAPSALPSHLPLANKSANARGKVLSSAVKGKAKKGKGKVGTIAVDGDEFDGEGDEDDGTGIEVPAFLAPDYTLNPAGPASNSDTDFKCPNCDKVYRGKHARSIWRRHLQDKHGIPLSAQPKRTRWDNDASRPKSEEEKRARTLDSKRKWARRNRAGKSGKDASANPTGDLDVGDGSVGTPASEDASLDFGDESADADSSFDATSVAGWTTEGAAAMNGLAGVARGGSAPLGAAPADTRFGAYGAPVARPAGLPQLEGYGPMRTANSLPPLPPYGNGQETVSLAGSSYQSYPSQPPSGNASPFHPSSNTNPYSHPLLSHSSALSGLPALEQSHLSHVGAPPPSLYDTSQGINPLNPLLAPPAHTIRRPASNPNPAINALPLPYDIPTASRHSPAPPGPILAGQIAPVANSYYSRRASPNRPLPPGLESPVKLGAKRPKPSGFSAVDGAQPQPHPHHPREDAAGILLALKAGPSSPMSLSHMQSPVSNLRDRDTAEEDEVDEDEARQVEAQLFGGFNVGHGDGARPSRRTGVLAEPVAIVSPQKRKRSASPPAAPAMTYSSSSGGEGSAAAAHALLATAKKAHSIYGSAGRPSAVRGATWTHASLVATPTPNYGWLRNGGMASSPDVGGHAGNGAGRESDGDYPADGDDEGEGDLRGLDDEPFSSSSGGRRPRGRSGSPTRKTRRTGEHGGSSSSGGVGGASSSSQPRPLGHPVGLTSELGDFDMHNHSSSSLSRVPHHHDPLRDIDDHPLSSSAPAGGFHPAHLQTPAQPARGEGSSSGTDGTNGNATLLSSVGRPYGGASHQTHYHDPFLAHSSNSGSATLLPFASATPVQPSAVPRDMRASSPPFTSYLFSSPAHPGFSKTLGLTAAPGPGVLSYGHSGEGTPGSVFSAGSGRFANGGSNGGGREREFSNGSIISFDGLISGMTSSTREAKTPKMARMGFEGVVGRRGQEDEDEAFPDEEDGEEEEFGEDEVPDVAESSGDDEEDEDED
ncbi:hypothetical protein JCM11641_000114 [Rhodosporidiobolus odoratus]